MGVSSQYLIAGLSNADVEACRKQGLGNDVKQQTSRSYSDIIRTNVFHPVNIVLYAIGFGMLLVGDVRSADTVVGLVIFNATVGIIQEVRSKRKLDEIPLLARAKVTVLLLGFAVIFSVPGLRAFFQLVMISPALLLAILMLTVLWIVVQRFIWRSNWLEHFLDMDFEMRETKEQ